MRMQEIRNLSETDLREELFNTLKELMNLRFRHVTKQLTDTSQLGITKKKIARLRTEMTQRILQEVKS